MYSIEVRQMKGKLERKSGASKSRRARETPLRAHPRAARTPLPAPANKPVCKQQDELVRMHRSWNSALKLSPCTPPRLLSSLCCTELPRSRDAVPTKLKGPEKNLSAFKTFVFS